MPRGVPNPAPAVLPRRRCKIKICDKPLSRYNPNDACLHHSPEEIKKFEEQERNEKIKMGLLEVAAPKPAVAGRRSDALGLVKIVAKVYGTSEHIVLQTSFKEGLPMEARRVAVYLMCRELSMGTEENRAFFGYSHSASVLRTLRKVEKALREDQRTVLMVAEIQAQYRKETGGKS